MTHRRHSGEEFGDIRYRTKTTLNLGNLAALEKESLSKKSLLLGETEGKS